MKFLSIFYNLLPVYGYALIIMDNTKKSTDRCGEPEELQSNEYAYFFTKITKKLRI